MLLATVPIYRQCGEVAPPHRFIAIVEAYMLALHTSLHRVSQEAKASPSYLYSLKASAQQRRHTRIDPVLVAGVVKAINSRLPEESHWPLNDAYAAAGVEDALRIDRKLRWSVVVPGAFLQRCFDRWRSLRSLRQAAIQISGGMHATSITDRAITKWDRALREWKTPPAQVKMNPITYFIFCAWMGETPDLRNCEERIVTLYERWHTAYEKERGNHSG